jgi:hypothetical protein
MRSFWLLIHFIGFTLWLGGGVATMLAGITAKHWAPGERLAAYRIAGRIHSGLIGPGVVFTLVSGLVLTRPFMGVDMTGGLVIMLLAGSVAGLIALFVSIPTAQRLGRLELHARDELPEAFRVLRTRQAVSASVAGILGILAMLGGTIFR